MSSDRINFQQLLGFKSVDKQAPVPIKQSGAAKVGSVKPSIAGQQPQTK